MCLSLKGAVIERGEKISSRKNVYKISCSDNTEVLVQADKTSEADDWCKDINLVIQKLVSMDWLITFKIKGRQGHDCRAWSWSILNS